MVLREEKVISLEEAIRRMTSLPAQKFGLKDRGMLKEGMAADIVIFDEKTIKLASIRTITKEIKLFEKPFPKWHYGIVFNKTFRDELEFYFSTEELRDQRYKELLERLESVGFKVMNL